MGRPRSAPTLARQLGNRRIAGAARIGIDRGRHGNVDGGVGGNFRGWRRLSGHGDSPSPHQRFESPEGRAAYRAGASPDPEKHRKDPKRKAPGSFPIPAPRDEIRQPPWMGSTPYPPQEVEPFSPRTMAFFCLCFVGFHLPPSRPLVIGIQGVSLRNTATVFSRQQQWLPLAHLQNRQPIRTPPFSEYFRPCACPATSCPS